MEDVPELGSLIRDARLSLGLTQVALAKRAGISASYLSRIEGATYLEGGPWPSDSVLRALARALNISSARLVALRDRARSGTRAAAGRAGSGRAPYGVRIGDEEVQQATRQLIERAPRGSTIRMTEVLVDHPRVPLRRGRAECRDALSAKLAREPETVLHCVCVSPGGRVDLPLTNGARIGNVRTRYCLDNPLMIDLLITEQEALIALPDRRGHPYLRACLVVEDPDFVTALRQWYDEFLWEAACSCQEVRFPEAGDGRRRTS